MKKNLRYFMTLLLMMVASVGWAQDSWVKTALTDLATGDIVVIVDQTTSMAMANNGGTSSAPTATTVELTSDKNGISSEVAATLQWVVTVSDNSYKFGVNGTSDYLYCTNTNNGVRVGTNSNNAFTLTDNFLFNSATSRYLGVYNSQDWRCYTSINSNIRDCVTAFYKKISASGKKDATASIGSTSLYLNETTEVSVTGPEFSLRTTDATVASVSGSTVTAVGVGEATITATWDGNEEYNEGSESFTVTVKDPNAAGEKDNPYTVAQARAAIDAGTGITGVYATGIVSQVDSYNSNYHSITYWISADGTTSSDQLEVYSGKGINGADFDSKDDILVGDEVIVYGNLKKYNTTYEFDLNNQLVSLKRTEKAEAGLAYETTEYTINKGESFTAPTLTNPNSLAVTYTSNNESVASVTSDGVVTISGVGTTTIKATFAGNDDYLPGSASYTLTVIDPNAPGSTAENPYTVAQARAAIDANASINGVYATGIVSKVDSYNSNDKYITYWISDDGTTTDQLEAYKGKGIDGADFESKDDIQVGDVVVIKGNLKKYNSTYEFDAGNQLVSLQRKTDPNISFSVESLTITQGDEFEAPTFNNENNVEVTFTTTNGDVATWDATNGLTLGTATGTATITATFEGNTTYKYATAQLTVTVNAQITPITGDYYEKVTSTEDITDGEYLIVYETGNVAFDGSLETLDAEGNTIPVTIVENKIAATEATNAATFTIDTTNGTLKSASGQYIGVSSNSNGLKQTTESDTYTHSFSFDADGNAVIAAVFEGSTMTLRYNSASNQARFRYYKSGQQAIQLYKKVESSVETEEVPVNQYGKGTYVTKKALDFTGITTVTAYVATAQSGSDVTFDPVTKVPAGTPLLVKGETTDVPVIASAEEIGTNFLVAGSGEGVASVAGGKYNFILNYLNNAVGFYRAAGMTVAADRAYLSLDSDIPAGSAKVNLIFSDEESTGINNVNAVENTNEKVFNLAGQQMKSAVKGVYIKNGKKYIK